MDYLVFTGDLVDARYITQKAQESPDIERPLIHKKLLEDSFLRAREYLNYLSSRLGVPNKDVLLCCGNHDVNRAVLPCLEVPCVCRSDVKTNTESFREWDMVAREFGDMSVSHETKLVVRNEFFFLIINTNWNVTAHRNVNANIYLSHFPAK